MHAHSVSAARVELELEVVDVVQNNTDQATGTGLAQPVSSRPEPGWMSGDACPADARTMLAPRRRSA
jgi:hypothetical protein